MNNKKVLMIATYGDFYAAFEKSNIQILNELGIEVHLCANWSDKKYNYKEEKLTDLKFQKIDIEFDRSPLSLKNVKAMFKLKKVISMNDYYLVDCHNAVTGFYGRIISIICRVKKIMYTAHGFQFFKQGKIIDWIFFYPIEKILSIFTNQMIVINNEDYDIAKKMHSKEVTKIPGVGLDYQYFSENIGEKNILKKEFCFSSDSFILISIGELSKRKNQEVILRALEKIKNKKIIYLIVGQGSEESNLKRLSKELLLDERVYFLGHRNDIRILNNISDVALFPSKREGLGMAALESMASGLPLISSNVHGINDYSINEYTGFKCNPDNVLQFAESITELYDNEKLRDIMSQNAKKVAKEFDVKNVESTMKRIYQNILDL